MNEIFIDRNVRLKFNVTYEALGSRYILGEGENKKRSFLSLREISLVLPN